MASGFRDFYRQTFLGQPPNLGPSVENPVLDYGHDIEDPWGGGGGAPPDMGMGGGEFMPEGPGMDTGMGYPEADPLTGMSPNSSTLPPGPEQEPELLDTREALRDLLSERSKARRERGEYFQQQAQKKTKSYLG